jgi:hypothetical protein
MMKPVIVRFGDAEDAAINNIAGGAGRAQWMPCRMEFGLGTVGDCGQSGSS